MNIALRNEPPRDNLIDDAEQDDERNSLSALLLILPPDAGEIPYEAANSGELVTVVMVGRGDLFNRRAHDYQQRHAQAQAEWDAWDDLGDEWGEAHTAKLDELSDKYDLGSFAACGETQFRIVEVLEQPGLI